MEKLYRSSVDPTRQIGLDTFWNQIPGRRSGHLDPRPVKPHPWCLQRPFLQFLFSLIENYCKKILHTPKYYAVFTYAKTVSLGNTCRNAVLPGNEATKGQPQLRSTATVDTLPPVRLPSRKVTPTTQTLWQKLRPLIQQCSWQTTL